MNKDCAEGDLDFSGMSDDELSEIVNSSFGRYRQEVVDGAKNELEKRGGDDVLVESNQQVMSGEVRPPALPENVSGSKLFSAGQITLATFLGAPIAGCLLLAQNYRALGKGESAWQPVVVGIVSTMLLLILALFLPEKFPNMALPAGSCFGMYYYAKQMQGGVIDEHLKAGGRKGSFPVTIAVGLGCLVLNLVLLFAIVITFNLQDEPVAKVRVSRAGQIELDGTRVTHQQLRIALAGLKDEGGKVMYYREGLNEPPSEEAARVFKTIMDAGLPIRISSKPDFSDSIGPEGIPVSSP